MFLSSSLYTRVNVRASFCGSRIPFCQLPRLCVLLMPRLLPPLFLRLKARRKCVSCVVERGRVERAGPPRGQSGMRCSRERERERRCDLLLRGRIQISRCHSFILSSSFSPSLSPSPSSFLRKALAFHYARESAAAPDSLFRH